MSKLIDDGNVSHQQLFAIREVLEYAASRHKTKELLVAWLDTPAGANGRTPAQLLAENEINRARLLAVSSPSPRLVPPPALVNRPVPKGSRATPRSTSSAS